MACRTHGFPGRSTCRLRAAHGGRHPPRDDVRELHLVAPRDRTQRRPHEEPRLRSRALQHDQVDVHAHTLATSRSPDTRSSAAPGAGTRACGTTRAGAPSRASAARNWRGRTSPRPHSSPGARTCSHRLASRRPGPRTTRTRRPWLKFGDSASPVSVRAGLVERLAVRVVLRARLRRLEARPEVGRCVRASPSPAPGRRVRAASRDRRALRARRSRRRGVRERAAWREIGVSVSGYAFGS